MSDLKTSIKINLGGNLPRKATSFAGSVRKIGTSAVKTGGLVNRSFVGLGRGLDRLGNKFTALAAGIGGIAAIKGVADMQRHFTRLGNQVGATEEHMQKLKDRIFDVARQPEIKINPDRIIEAVDQIIDKTGDLKFVEDNLDNIAIALQSTGAAGTDIGQIFVDLKTKFKLDDPIAMMKEFSRLVAQGDEGAMPLVKLGKIAPGVLAAYAALNRSGTDSVREAGSLLQTIAGGVGSVEVGATAFQGIIRDIQTKIVPLESAGIKIFDDKSTNTMRSLPDILSDIFKLTKGDATQLRKIFGDESYKGITALLASFDRTSLKITGLDRFLSIQADANKLTEKSARAAKDAQAIWDSLGATWRKAANTTLLPVLKGVSKWTDGLDAKKLDSYASSVLKLGAAFGGLMIAKKLGVFGALGKVSGAIRSKGSTSRADVSPVFVTNMPAGFGGASSGGTGSFFSRTNKAAGGTKKGFFGRILGKIDKKGRLGKIAGVLGKIPGLGKITKLAKFAKIGGKALPLLGGLFTIANIGSTLLDDSKSTAEKVADTVGPTIGSAIGGAIGSALLPGLGTAAGMGIGSALGSLVGDFFAEPSTKKESTAPNKVGAVDLSMVLDMTPELRKLIAPKRVQSDGDMLLRYRSGPMMAGAQ